MPANLGEMVFLRNVSQYSKEKPYLVLLPPFLDAEIDRSTPRDNLEWERHKVVLTDIRDRKDEYLLDRCGFQVLHHTTQISSLVKAEQVTKQDVDAYKAETASLLRDVLDPVYVFCYDFRVTSIANLQSLSIHCAAGTNSTLASCQYKIQS